MKLLPAIASHTVTHTSVHFRNFRDVGAGCVKHTGEDLASESHRFDVTKHTRPLRYLDLSSVV